MKRTLLGTLALLAGAVAVHAQGTVSLANYAVLSTYIYIGYTPGALLGGSATGPAPTLVNYASEVGNGNDWSVQLWGGLGSVASSSLVPLTGETGNMTATMGTTEAEKGVWYSSALYAFPSAPAGTVATVQLYAWYNEGGLITSYVEAEADGVPHGSSATGNVTLNAPFNPAALPALGNFYVGPIGGPEPSTIVLGVIGASAFLMRPCRKN